MARLASNQTNLFLLIVSLITHYFTLEKKLQIATLKLQTISKKQSSCLSVDKLVQQQIHSSVEENKFKLNNFAKPPIFDPLEATLPYTKDYQNIQNWDKEWKNRILRHRKACQRFQDRPSLIEQFRNFYQTGEYVKWELEPMTVIDRNHKLLYCAMPKGGSTNWKLTIRLMEDLEKESESDDSSSNKWSSRKGSNWGWTSRKDAEGYRIRRSPSPEVLSSLESVNAHLKEVKFLDEFVQMDTFEKFEFPEKDDREKPDCQNITDCTNFGRFPLSAIPPR